MYKICKTDINSIVIDNTVVNYPIAVANSQL